MQYPNWTDGDKRVVIFANPRPLMITRLSNFEDMLATEMQKIHYKSNN